MPGSQFGRRGANKAFVRINQVPSGDTYRVNSNTLYSNLLNTWIHLAATYDGATLKLYVNGVLENQLATTVVINQNTLPLAIGAEVNGSGGATRWLQGAMDDARVYNRALTDAEVLALLGHTITATAGANGSISPSGAVTVAHGGNQTFTITPNGGYSVANVLVDGASAGPVTAYAFTNVTANHTITATFTGANSAPNQPALNAPPDGGTGVSTSPTLDVTVSDPDSNPLTVTYYGRPVTGSDFSIVVLPDTQNYPARLNGGDETIFQAQTGWVVTNHAARNVAFVSHVGDCVNTANVTIEWDRAVTAMAALENPATTGLPYGIPYHVGVGNHDEWPNGDPTGTAIYGGYFGASRFAGRSYYGGHYDANNANHYVLFSASGLDFIAISIEYGATSVAGTLNWASDQLASNPNRRGIVISHELIGTGNPASFSGGGQAIYDALKANPNLFLMLCGHVPGEGRRSDTYNGHTVYTVLADYQGEAHGGDGWMRIMTFQPAQDQIQVATYSPTLDQYRTGASSQFSLGYDMSSPQAWQQIGANTNVPSGSSSTMVWPGLAPGTQYEWYVTVSDGQETTTSPTWTLTTAAGDTHTITASAGANGSISPSGTVVVGRSRGSDLHYRSKCWPPHLGCPRGWRDGRDGGELHVCQCDGRPYDRGKLRGEPRPSHRSPICRPRRSEAETPRAPRPGSSSHGPPSVEQPSRSIAPGSGIIRNTTTRAGSFLRPLWPTRRVPTGRLLV